MELNEGDVGVVNTAGVGDWARRLTASVGAQIRTMRRAQDLSAQALADRTAALGHEVKRSVIADMENGRRPTVAASDLLILAAALGVPPIALLIQPAATNGPIEVLPGVTESPWEAYDWIVGARVRPPSLAGGDRSLEHWRAAQDPFGHKFQFDHLVRQMMDSVRLAYQYRTAKNADELAAREEEKRRQIDLQLIALLERMTAAGYSIPDGLDEYRPDGL
ncbi:transcriptional regulator with XRE-family HTH domain [Marisediminicola sp. UYEF4]|uniref:helix-turn-helix domain-containing protein n=1 Tax=Marisediminicola sp. UYEF4 TaxID=1756384 RepID=UPI003395E587